MPTPHPPLAHAITLGLTTDRTIFCRLADPADRPPLAAVAEQLSIVLACHLLQPKEEP